MRPSTPMDWAFVGAAAGSASTLPVSAKAANRRAMAFPSRLLSVVGFIRSSFEPPATSFDVSAAAIRAGGWLAGPERAASGDAAACKHGAGLEGDDRERRRAGECEMGERPDLGAHL